MLEPNLFSLDFKLKINIKPINHNRSINNKKKNIYIKYIIFYILITDYIINNNMDSISTQLTPTSKGINHLLKLSRLSIIKKARKITILYSPNRHKKAQKHLKFEYFLISFSLLLLNNPVNKNYVQNLKPQSIVKILVDKIEDQNNKSKNLGKLKINDVSDVYIYLLRRIRIFLDFSIINISLYKIRLKTLRNIKV